MHKTQATVDGSITLKNGGWRKLCGSGDCNLCSRQQAVDQARCDRLPGGAQGGWVGGTGLADADWTHRATVDTNTGPNVAGRLRDGPGLRARESGPPWGLHTRNSAWGLNLLLGPVPPILSLRRSPTRRTSGCAACRQRTSGQMWRRPGLALGSMSMIALSGHAR